MGCFLKHGLFDGLFFVAVIQAAHAFGASKLNHPQFEKEVTTLRCAQQQRQNKLPFSCGKSEFTGVRTSLAICTHQKVARLSQKEVDDALGIKWLPSDCRILLQQKKIRQEYLAEGVPLNPTLLEVPMFGDLPEIWQDN